jgi:hypothetical protein
MPKLRTATTYPYSTSSGVAREAANGHATNGHASPKSPGGKSRPPDARSRDLPELAREPNLVAAIRRDLGSVVVGESDNALLVYLVYTSRILDDPAAVVARGETSTGKSRLLKGVARFFPDAAKVEAMQMTPAAWFNTPEDYFRHKVFLAGERKHSQDDAAKDAGALLRQLLSEKRIDRGVSVYDEPSRAWRTVMVQREGPVAYAESTTAESVFAEDLNRMLQVTTDGSARQSRRVMEAMAARYDPDAAPAGVEAAVKRHHEFQSYLQGRPARRVGIPYFKALGALMPARKAEGRRVFQQVLTVVEAAVVLRGHAREGSNGCLIATLDDYALARRLLMAPLSRALGVGEEQARAKALRSKFPRGSRFTTPQVREALGHTNAMQTSRLLDALVTGGLIVRVEAKSGSRPAVYAWAAGMDIDREVTLLPTVAEVKGWRPASN